MADDDDEFGELFGSAAAEEQDKPYLEQKAGLTHQQSAGDEYADLYGELYGEEEQQPKHEEKVANGTAYGQVPAYQQPPQQATQQPQVQQMQQPGGGFAYGTPLAPSNETPQPATAQDDDDDFTILLDEDAPLTAPGAPSARPPDAPNSAGPGSSHKYVRPGLPPLQHAAPAPAAAALAPGRSLSMERQASFGPRPPPGPPPAGPHPAGPPPAGPRPPAPIVGGFGTQQVRPPLLSSGPPPPLRPPAPPAAPWQQQQQQQAQQQQGGVPLPYVPMGVAGMQVAARIRDQDAAWPSQAAPGQTIKLPRQTRVAPEEYKEFLALGHGEIFTLDVYRVTDAPWRHPTADLSDYFNYGLNERTWTDYQHAIEKFRAEYKMREKIEVYPPEPPAGLDVAGLPQELADALLEHARAKNDKDIHAYLEHGLEPRALLRRDWRRQPDPDALLLLLDGPSIALTDAEAPAAAAGNHKGTAGDGVGKEGSEAQQQDEQEQDEQRQQDQEEEQEEQEGQESEGVAGTPGTPADAAGAGVGADAAAALAAGKPWEGPARRRRRLKRAFARAVNADYDTGEAFGGVTVSNIPNIKVVPRAPRPPARPATGEEADGTLQAGQQQGGRRAPGFPAFVMPAPFLPAPFMPTPFMPFPTPGMLAAHADSKPGASIAEGQPRPPARPAPPPTEPKAAAASAPAQPSPTAKVEAGQPPSTIKSEPLPGLMAEDYEDEGGFFDGYGAGFDDAGPSRKRLRSDSFGIGDYGGHNTNDPLGIFAERAHSIGGYGGFDGEEPGRQEGHERQDRQQRQEGYGWQELHDRRGSGDMVQLRREREGVLSPRGSGYAPLHHEGRPPPGWEGPRGGRGYGYGPDGFRDGGPPGGPPGDRRWGGAGPHMMPRGPPEGFRDGIRDGVRDGLRDDREGGMARERLERDRAAREAELSRRIREREALSGGADRDSSRPSSRPRSRSPVRPERKRSRPRSVERPRHTEKSEGEGRDGRSRDERSSREDRGKEDKRSRDDRAASEGDGSRKERSGREGRSGKEECSSREGRDDRRRSSQESARGRESKERR